MKKTSLSLIAAGLLAGAAGVAQAAPLTGHDGGTLSGHTVLVTTAPNSQKTFWIDTPVLVGHPIPGAMPVATIDNTPLHTLAIAPGTSVLGAAASDTRVLGAGPAAVPEVLQIPGERISVSRTVR